MDKTKTIESAEFVGKPAKRVIRLEDIDGEDEVLGGSGQKLFFGENPDGAAPFSGLFSAPPPAGRKP